MQTFQLGWPDDDGLGAMLCQQVIDGIKTATCSMKASFLPGELDADLAQVGELHRLIDGTDRAWGVIRLLEIFETSFGDPDPRLVAGEGNGNDARQFQADHVRDWPEALAQAGWPDVWDIPLIVYLFEFVEPSPPNGAAGAT